MLPAVLYVIATMASEGHIASIQSSARPIVPSMAFAIAASVYATRDSKAKIVLKQRSVLMDATCMEIVIVESVFASQDSQGKTVVLKRIVPEQRRKAQNAVGMGNACTEHATVTRPTQVPAANKRHPAQKIATTVVCAFMDIAFAKWDLKVKAVKLPIK